MLKIKHKTFRSVEIQVIDALRKIDADGWVLDLTEVEQERLTHFDEFIAYEDFDTKFNTQGDVVEEKVAEPEADVKEQPKRGRPAGTSKK